MYKAAHKAMVLAYLGVQVFIPVTPDGPDTDIRLRKNGC